MGWDWGKKLGGAPAAPPAPAYGNPNLPRGMGVDHGRAIEHYMENRTPQGYQQPWEQQQAIQREQEQWVQKSSSEATKMSEVLPIWQWGGNKKGAASEGLGPCPGCGGPRYVQGKYGSVMNEKTGVVAYPFPTCWDCGYPNEQGMVGGAAVTSGPAQAARASEAPAPAGSMAFIKR
jgi:hypothetical protein